MKNRTPASNLAFSITVVAILLAVAYLVSFPFRAFPLFFPAFPIFCSIILFVVGALSFIAIIRRLTANFNKRRFLYIFPAVANVAFGSCILLSIIFEEIPNAYLEVPFGSITLGIVMLVDVYLLPDKKSQRLQQ